MHDVSNRWTRNKLDPLILSFLREYSFRPSFLILNKVDKFRNKRILFDVIKSTTCNNISLSPSLKSVKNKELVEDSFANGNENGWPHFQKVFMVSSLKGDGVAEVVDYVSSLSTEAPWKFRKNESTDQNPETLIVNFVRARLLDYMPQEIPYKLTVELDYFSNENNRIFASVIIKCPNSRYEKLLCGAFDGKLRQITDRVTSDIIESFRVPATLTITSEVIRNEK